MADFHELSNFEKSVDNELSTMGVLLRVPSLKRLCKSTSSLQGAVQYYFDNTELYDLRGSETVAESKSGRKSWKHYIDENMDTKNEIKSGNNDPFDDLRKELKSMDFDDSRISEAFRNGCKNLDSALEFLHAKENPILTNKPDKFDESKCESKLEFVPVVTESKCDSILAELLKLGFSKDDANHACSQCHTLEEAIYYLTSKGKDTEKSFECLLCREAVSYSSMYTLSCCRSHSYCVGCVVRHMASVLMKDESNSPHIPACPEANGKEGCNYLMTEREIDEVLYMAEQMILAGHLDIGLSVEELREFSSQGKSLYLAKAYRDMGYVRCVGCTGAMEDGFWFELPETEGGAVGSRLFVRCPRCKVQFCGRCRSKPYHFGCTCEEVLELSRKWLEWSESGRDAYMAELARQGAQYKELVAQYNDRKAAFEEESRTVRQRHMELVENERWKEQHCKLCPNCDRVVEKIDGCDLMVCGRNYHGGDVQMGCGSQFNWLEAKPYVADAGHMREVDDFVLVEPEPMDVLRKQSARHFVFEKFAMRCDLCDKGIIGPRINCINCRIFNMCLSCSLTDQHSKDHCCQVFF